MKNETNTSVDEYYQRDVKRNIGKKCGRTFVRYCTCVCACSRYMESFPRHRHKLCANIVLPRWIRGARRGSRTYPSGSRDSQARSRGSINARERNERGRWDRGALGFAGSLREITSCVIILWWRGEGGGIHTPEVFYDGSFRAFRMDFSALDRAITLNATS